MSLASTRCNRATKSSSSAARARKRGSRSTYARWRLRLARFRTKSFAGLARESRDNTSNSERPTSNSQQDRGIWDGCLGSWELTRVMKTPRVVFACQECGAQSPKWMGRCADCGAWNSLVEESAAEPSTASGTNLYAQLGAAGSAQHYAEVCVAACVRVSYGDGT